MPASVSLTEENMNEDELNRQRFQGEDEITRLKAQLEESTKKVNTANKVLNLLMYGTENPFKTPAKIEVLEKRLADVEKGANRGCLCTLTKPCKDSCSCASSVQSGGCHRCYRYGSEDQRKKAAETIASVEKEAARMKAVVDAAIKWREARRAIPDAQLLDDPMEEAAAATAYDNAIRRLQNAVSELE